MRIWKKVLSVMLVVVMLAVSVPVVQAEGDLQIPADVVEFNGSLYKLFEESKTWYEAKAACEAIGGHLVTINTSAENAFLTQLLTEKATKNCYWTAITYDYTSDVWVNYDGSVIEKHNWAENEPNDYKNMNEAFVHLFGKSFVGIGEKRVGTWNDSAAEGAGYAHPFYALENFGYICEWGSGIKPEEPTKIFPEGYDFYEDSYNFGNFSEKIDLQYFVDLYEEQKGTEIYNYREGKAGTNGHCFGMAVSTAATLINAPYVKDYISWTGLPYTKLHSVNRGTMNIDMDISAKDYIKYCHIYQDSAYVCRQRNSESHSGIANVYNAVKNAVMANTDCSLIVIDLWGGSGGHTVYAAGIDGSDILVNDSNAKELQRIKINGDGWTYSAAGFYWDSSVDATINYVENCIEPYLRLVWNIDVEGRNVPKDDKNANLYTEDSEMNGTNNYYSNYVEPIDTDKLLIVSEDDSFSFCEINSIYKVLSTDGDGTDNTDSLYWLDDGDTINAENISDSPAMLKLVGNELKISAEMPVDSTAEMTVNENGENKATFGVDISEPLAIAFTTLDENNEFVDIHLSATATDTQITATQTDTGLVVTGIDNGTITLTQDEEVVATKRITKAIGDVKITYDADGSSDDLDVEYPHICADYNHNGKCDICTETLEAVKNCNCMCHKSGFMALVYAFVNLFWRVFGTNKSCDCGVYHW